MKFDSFVEPMLLSEQEEAFDDESYIFELKFDGIRATLHASPKGVRIFTRRGTEVTNQFPELQKIKEIVTSRVIFDGEIVSFENGKPSFAKLQRRNLLRDAKKIATMSEKEPVLFVAFDCLYAGRDLRKRPLLERKAVLDEYFESEEFAKTKYVRGNGKKLFARVQKQGLEGIVAKKVNSLYYTGVRTKDWIKIKNFKVESFVVGGYIENKEKVSLLLGEYRGRKLYFVGKVAMMRDVSLYKKLVAARIASKSPFIDYEEPEAKYVPSKYACEVVYIERTPSGHLRQPVFKREVKMK